MLEACISFTDSDRSRMLPNEDSGYLHELSRIRSENTIVCSSFFICDSLAQGASNPLYLATSSNKVLVLNWPVQYKIVISLMINIDHLECFKETYFSKYASDGVSRARAPLLKRSISKCLQIEVGIYW